MHRLKGTHVLTRCDGRRFLRTLATALVGALLTVPPVDAQDETLTYRNPVLYSYDDSSSCEFKAIADPITVFFHGSAATTRYLAGYDRGGPFQADVRGHVTAHTQWARHNTDNLFEQRARIIETDDQGRETSNRCSKNNGDEDLASRSGFGHDRGHLRMWSETRVGERRVKMTPHFEDWHWKTDDNDCGKTNNAPDTGSHAVERGAVDRRGLEERNGSGFDRARRFIAATHRAGQRHDVSIYNAGNTRSVKQCDREYAGSNGYVAYIQVGR